MNDAAPRDGGLLDLIHTSVRDRQRLCELVLATYRVDLTRTLRRLADGNIRSADATHVRTLATSIAAAANAAGFPTIRVDAVRLEHRAAIIAESGGSKREQGAMLVAGLKLIDRILDTTKVDAGGRGESRDAALN